MCRASASLCGTLQHPARDQLHSTPAYLPPVSGYQVEITTTHTHTHTHVQCTHKQANKQGALQKNKLWIFWILTFFETFFGKSDKLAEPQKGEITKGSLI